MLHLFFALFSKFCAKATAHATAHGIIIHPAYLPRQRLYKEGELQEDKYLYLSLRVKKVYKK